VRGDVEEVLEVLVARAQQGPRGAGALEDVAGLPLAGVVAQEGSVEAGVRVLHQLHLEGEHTALTFSTADHHRGSNPGPLTLS